MHLIKTSIITVLALMLCIGVLCGTALAYEDAEYDDLMSEIIEIIEPFYDLTAIPFVPQPIVPDVGNPFTPDGTGTVIDNAADGDDHFCGFVHQHTFSYRFLTG